jgi:molybdopterin converting factor small subunit
MIRILLFGSLADKLGQREIMLSIDHGMCLGDIAKEIGCDGLPLLLFAINQQQETNREIMVQDGDEVAIMPPFSGG